MGVVNMKRLLEQWSLEEGSGDLFELDQMVSYMASRLYNDYEPDQYRNFEVRLGEWIGNVEDDEDRKSLFRLLGHVFYLGRQETDSLSRAALHGPVTRWLIDTLGIAFDDPQGDTRIQSALRQTWFCPVTDSLRINGFYKVNNLAAPDLRPDWKSLAKFGDRARILDYVRVKGLQRLVLLEDFVGTGRQMRDAVSYAASLDKKLPVLACPLVVCPEGDKVGRKLEGEHPNLTYRPVMVLPQSVFLKPHPEPGEPGLFAKLRDLISRVEHRLGVGRGKGVYGFEDTGALVIMFSNCPNNTISIIRVSNDAWRPLFQRVGRL